MDDIAFEVGADLRNKIGMFLIAVNEMIHFHIDHLLDMSFFDIVGREIENDAQCSDNEDAERC